MKCGDPKKNHKTGKSYYVEECKTSEYPDDQKKALFDSHVTKLEKSYNNYKNLVYPYDTLYTLLESNNSEI